MKQLKTLTPPPRKLTALLAALLAAMTLAAAPAMAQTPPRIGQMHCPGVTEMNAGIIGMGNLDVKRDSVSIRPAPSGFGITNVRDVAAGAWQADVYFALMDSNHNFVHYVYYPLGRLHVGNPNDLYPPLSTHLSLKPNTRYYAKIFLRDIRGASVTEATYGIRCFRTRP